MPTEVTSDNHNNLIESDTNAIIDFWAEWCGPCKRMTPEYHNAEKYMKSIGSDVKFLSVDVDDQSDIASQYQISSLPTLIIIKNGKIVEINTGSLSCEQIITLLGKHFNVEKK
jgi:thioredoxin 1